MLKFRLPTFKKTQSYLERKSKLTFRGALNAIGSKGVQLLSEATPIDTGETSKSWDYSVDISTETSTITWTNSVMAGSTPLVILIKHGHGTGTGGYIAANDFVSPAVTNVVSELLKLIAAEVAKR